MPAVLVLALSPGLLGLTATSAASATVPAVAPAPTAGAAEVGAPDLPGDFSLSLESSAGSPALVWDGVAVQTGGALHEFRLGTEVLGYPKEVDGTLQLALDPATSRLVERRADELAVWSAGTRLDTTEAATGTPAGSGTSAATPPVSTSTRSTDLDPGQPGTYGTERLSYELDPLPMPVEDYPEPVEVLAEVTRPVGAEGERPLVVVLHGKWSTCFTGGPDGRRETEWPCPQGTEPIPSYQGHRYLTDVLASQGYVTVSVSANAISAQDDERPGLGADTRSILVRHHLDLWADWVTTGGDPWGGLFQGGVDLDRVGLVGHSRGGEGVHRAAVDASVADPYRIRGVVALAPTAFGRQVAPDVHAATVLPTCDGDVRDLEGQMYVDESRDIADSAALRSAVVTVGANHNFFNTEWTPGLSRAPGRDDWRTSADPVCGTDSPTRLSATEQQVVTTQYTMALLRLALADDEAMLPLLDGTPVTPVAVGDAEIGVNAVGGDSTWLYRPEISEEDAVLSAGMTGGTCDGHRWNPDFTLATEGVCGAGQLPAPHWETVLRAFERPAPKALELSWTDPGARVRLPVTVDLTGHDRISVRVANDPAAVDPAELAVEVTDATGATTSVPVTSGPVAGWPGEGNLDRVHARTLQADLSQLPAGDVDLGRITAVDLVTVSASGRVWLIDAAATTQRLRQPDPLDLPQVSVENVRVPEGGDRVRTVEVPITVEETLTAPAEVWVEILPRVDDSASPVEGPEDFRLRLPAGASGTVHTVELPVVGDDWYSGRERELDGGRVLVYSEEEGGALTGDHHGGVTLVEDDPVPELSAVAADVVAAEGESLRWTVTLSEPSAGGTYFFTAVPPTGGGTELDSDDVDPGVIEAFANSYGRTAEQVVPGPALPLSQVGVDTIGLSLLFRVPFGPGQQEAEIELPIVADGVAEGPEVVELRTRNDLFSLPPRLPDADLTVTGSVTASD